jgi:hypothetical protein
MKIETEPIDPFGAKQLAQGIAEAKITALCSISDKNGNTTIDGSEPTRRNTDTLFTIHLRYILY